MRLWAQAACVGGLSCGTPGPTCEWADIRGNVDTRLRKVDNGEFDAIVLAEAGLERLGLAGFITEVLAKT